ncbi:MAG: hypothetical protein RMK97_01905 [Sutterellaceae bacterium]|nr:hypothetical protein [Burkholderiaceae bacterium]MDW8429248.1 hypothetical protein [Sutterellaceae bacterium]
MDDKLRLTPVASLQVPLGGQQIELQQVDFVHGGISLLRVRIREGRRFTVFDIDPGSAAAWGAAMLRWANQQPAGADSPQ